MVIEGLLAGRLLESGTGKSRRLMLSGFLPGAVIAISLTQKRAMYSQGNGRLVVIFNPYPTAFPYGNGMVLHFYQQQESSTTKTVHRVINQGLKTYV